MQLNVMATFAEFEREMIRDRQADALTARTAHGLRSGGRLPLGYASEPRTKQLVIVAKEAALVRDSFRALDDGERPQAIAERLNARARETRRVGAASGTRGRSCTSDEIARTRESDPAGRAACTRRSSTRRSSRA
jgi:DNA invertase Pin-like site-specific DNA recombinase